MAMIRHASCLVAILVIQGLAQIKTGKPAAYLRQATVIETVGVVHITANSPRPLLQMLDALQRRYGWIVGYEDPRYSSHLDLVDVVDNGLPTELPAGGEFSVEFPASSPKPEKILRLIVDAYNQGKNPGRFELRRGAEGDFYIAGIAAHNEKGTMSEQQPMFDAAVTLTTQERTIADTLDLICHAVTAQGQINIVVGVSPRTVLEYRTVRIGGTKISARELLLQCLRATHRNLYWRLLFNPTSNIYFLDIHSVRLAPDHS